jgi:hypothetical protein
MPSKILARNCPEINSRILTWTLHALDEDHELEQFFASILGFCSSEAVPDPEHILAELDMTLTPAFLVFLYRTLSSSPLSEADKKKAATNLRESCRYSTAFDCNYKHPQLCFRE